jgi:hypothetical protein
MEGRKERLRSILCVENMEGQEERAREIERKRGR